MLNLKIGDVIQQGDVILLKIDKIPDGGQDKKKNGKIILAEGETTGHKHEIIIPKRVLSTIIKEKPVINFIEKNGNIYLSTNIETEIQHEEHGLINLPAGNYELFIAKEYDHFSEEAKKVVD